jgi:aspartate-semialdehyde dehydrogenase
MKVAVLGATGAVGRTMLDILESRQFPVSELVLLASERSPDSTLHWGGGRGACGRRQRTRSRLRHRAVLRGAARSREWAPVAAAAGAT